MRALHIVRHGPVDQLKVSDQPQPAPGPDQVLVQVLAAGLNPSDVASAQGRFPHAPLPRILGRDFAGRVVEGPHELIGAEVWGSGGDLGITRDGTHAEFVVLPRDGVALRPGRLSAEAAAAAGVPFVTAWTALMDLGGIKVDEWVVVSGATGAVGTAAAQIARWAGAHVLALVRNAAEQERLDLGLVTAVARLDTGDLPEVARRHTGGNGCALALNGIGSSVFRPLLDALAEGGRMVVYSVIGGAETPLDLFSFYRRRLALYGLNTGWLNSVDCARILTTLAPLFESGAIRPPAIAEHYPVERAAEAYGRVAQGAHGKVVLVMDA
jgi:NADPH2:quinone reductase